MAPTPARRWRLGSSSHIGLASTQEVYRTPDAIEAHEIEGSDVSCRRVLLDEVLLVTIHRAYGLPFVFTMLALVTVLGPIGALLTVADRWLGLGWLALTTLPPLVALGLRFALGVDIVTVFGRRTRVRLAFWFRKAAARDTFLLVCRLARERQQRLVPRSAPQQPGPV